MKDNFPAEEPLPDELPLDELTPSPPPPTLDRRPKRRLDQGMKAKLFALLVALLMVGCGDPGEEIINVTLYNRGETTQLTVRVNDLEWYKQDGHWIGTPKNKR